MNKLIEDTEQYNQTEPVFSDPYQFLIRVEAQRVGPLAVDAELSKFHC